MMIIFKKVTECDMTKQEYFEAVEGIAYVAQGASGRWCEVLWGGPEELAKLEAEGIEILTEEQARNKILTSGNGWVDFGA